MNVEQGWIVGPQPPRLQRHRSYASYRLQQIDERERARIRDAERQALRGPH